MANSSSSNLRRRHRNSSGTSFDKYVASSLSTIPDNEEDEAALAANEASKVDIIFLIQGNLKILNVKNISIVTCIIKDNYRTRAIISTFSKIIMTLKFSKISMPKKQLKFWISTVSKISIFDYLSIKNYSWKFEKIENLFIRFNCRYQRYIWAINIPWIHWNWPKYKINFEKQCLKIIVN